MTEREQLKQSIVALEAQRAILGDAVVDATIATLREKIEALSAPPPAEEQRKQVTVLFADVSGFTAMSETMDAEEVRDTMNALWAKLDAAITGQGGKIDKHIGDALMALFGAPTAREDDPERALHAALAMQEELQAFNELPHIQAIRTEGLRMRIGVNTGPVLLGSVGTTGEYTAMGDAVNLASRLEHAAPVGGILISHDTYRHVRGIFEMESLEPLAVKGKVEPIQVYVVKRALPRAFHVDRRGIEGIQTPMIGRDAEMHRLQETLHEVMEEREPGMVSVVGEAGVGKSRLRYEFERWLETLPEPMWIGRGRSEQQTSQLPYALIRDVMTSAFDIQESDSAAVAREKLVRGMCGFIGQAAEERAHFIGHLIGFDFSSSPYLQGILDDARQIRDLAFHHATQFFSAIAAMHSVALLFLDDIHWADDGSLDLLDHVARSARNVPLVIFVMTRNTLFERRPLWGEGREVHARLDLHPLSRRDSRRMVSAILSRLPEIPDELRDLVVSGSDGTPYYVEELIKMLIEDGIVVMEEPQWRVELGRLATVRVPPTLTGVLQARLDSLESAERETLQKASVAGQVFWDEAINCFEEQPNGHGDAEPGQETHLILAALRAKDLIFGRETSAIAEVREYTFKHAILHQVTYESVLRRLRRLYHQQMAMWLIEHSGERVTEHTGLIGRHYELAGETAKATEWYRRAGDEARAAYANEAAISYYKRLLALLPAADQTTALRNLGEVQQAIGQWDEAEANFRKALTLAENAQNLSEQAQGQTSLGALLNLKGAYGDALRCLEEARQLWERVGDRRGLGQAVGTMGLVHWQQGDYDRALACFNPRVEISREIGDRWGLGEALGHMGMVYRRQGDIQRALEHCEQWRQIAGELGNRRGVCAALGNIGIMQWEQGDLPGALATFEQSARIASEIGNRLFLGVAVANSGLVYWQQGDFDSALTCYEYSLQIASDLGNPLGVTAAIGNIADTYGARGEHDEAERLYARAIARWRAAEIPYGLCEYLHNNAAMFARQERHAEAQSLNEEAIATASQIGRTDVQFKAQVLSICLRLALQQTDGATAMAELEQMMPEWTEDEEQAALHYAIWHLDSTQEAHRAASATLYRDLYAKTPDWVFRQRYSELTGDPLPDPPPLPELPLIVRRQQVDLSALLAEADQSQAPSTTTG